MSRFAVEVPPAVSVLAPFVEAGVFGASEVHLADAVARLHRRDAAGGGLTDEEVLGLAIAARAPRLGHVCVVLDEVAERITGLDGAAGAIADRSGLRSTPPSSPPSPLPWPDPSAWASALDRSDLVQRPGEQVVGPTRPLVWDGHRLYLHRYEAYERFVADDLARRAGSGLAPLVADDLDALFPPPPAGTGTGGDDRQRVAAAAALARPVTVIAGGPGTGKTRTIARLLAAALSSGGASGAASGTSSGGSADGPAVQELALAAPTGKAAARMTDAVHAAVAEVEAAGIVAPEVVERLRAAEATTLHRLLGARPGGGFARNRHVPLPHDLVIVDETSMVSLPLMARLLDAVRPEARVVLVGDPDQLASVEAGTVLADLVGPTRGDGDGNGDGARSGPLAGSVTVLDRVHRFGEGSGIAALAAAVRAGDIDAVLGLLDGSRPDLRLVAPESTAVDEVREALVRSGVGVVEAARDGRDRAAIAAAGAVKVLAAHHRGANGRLDWSNQVERGVLDLVGDVDRRGRWYVGRPVLVAGNDPLNRVFNGDTGVAVATDSSSVGSGLAVALPDPRSEGGIHRVLPSRLREVDTWWAMTIHKSQGSELPHAVVALPTRADSPVLTRELLYTAVTRAREQVTIVATEEAVRAAVARPVARASGLATRLWS